MPKLYQKTDVDKPEYVEFEGAIIIKNSHRHVTSGTGCTELAPHEYIYLPSRYDWELSEHPSGIGMVLTAKLKKEIKQYINRGN